MNADIKPPILIIYGPTGVGKTDFALNIASKIPAEIINMDVGQLYAPLSIGTAKPDLSTVSVAHHGFDVLDKPENFTVKAYRILCEQLILDIAKRGKLPILVGGSGFYLKSLFFPPQELGQELDSYGTEYDCDTDTSDYGKSVNEEKSDTGDYYGKSVCEEKNRANQANQSSYCLWLQLQAIDPVRASHIHPQDTYRIKRALDIWLKTGKKPSDCKPYFNPIAIGSAHIVFLARDKKELYDRINQRVDLMIDAGWLEEVKKLLKTPWELFIRHKKLIGYNELIDFLQAAPDQKTHSKTTHGQGTHGTESAHADFASVLVAIKQRTRHYAKRQFTFWRTFALLCAHRQTNEPAVELPTLFLESVNLTLPSVDLYINQLVEELKIQKLRMVKNENMKNGNSDEE